MEDDAKKPSPSPKGGDLPRRQYDGLRPSGYSAPMIPRMLALAAATTVVVTGCGTAPDAAGGTPTTEQDLTFIEESCDVYADYLATGDHYDELGRLFGPLAVAVNEARESDRTRDFGALYRRVCPELYEPIGDRMRSADIDEYAVRVPAGHSSTDHDANYWVPYVREVCSRDPDQFLDEFAYLALEGDFDNEEVPYLRVACRDRFVEAYERLGLDVDTVTDFGYYEYLGS